MNDKQLALQDIVTAVAHEHNVSIDAMLGSSRLAKLSNARCKLVSKLMQAGYSTTTAATLLHRSAHQVRALLQRDTILRKIAKGYKDGIC